MPPKIFRLFKFLDENRVYNLELQKNVLLAWLKPYATKQEKAYSLLLNVYQTQSRPSLDNARLFFEKMYYSKEVLTSFKSFSQFLGVATDFTFHNLFVALNCFPGWGKKTTALFVKFLLQLKHHKELKELLFWADTPDLKSSDHIYLPVDQVILEVFRHIDNTKNSFDKINKFLGKEFSGHHFEIWDDLWFWGYFNQKGAGFGRELGFNPGKYWINSFTDKDPVLIKEIQNKSKNFVKILTS